ncbi:MAG: MATE family efflux transporter [Candidatus Merdivicinus sp.]
MFTGPALKKLIVPLVIEQILAVLVGMADVVMVSSAGEAAVSGVSLVDMINVLLINIFSALATGGAVVSAQFLGAGRQDKACDAANQLMSITILISAGIMGIVLLLQKPILRLFFGSISDDVMSSALTYLQISALSYPFLACYNSGAALFRSMNNSKVTMIVSAGMNVINIVGNAICIYGLDMKVAGVAIPSLISRAVAAIVIFWLLSSPTHVIHVRLRQTLRLNWEITKRILYIGIPSALENSMFQLGRVLVVSIISGFGTVQIAANAVANNLDSLGCIPGQALNLAIITVVGQCVGAHDYEQATYYTKKLLKITYLVMGIVCAGVIATMPLLFKLYNLSEETMQLAAILVVIHDGCAILFWPASFTMPNALRAANDVRFTMVNSIFSMWFFRILGSCILGSMLGMGAIGVWIAMVLDWIYRSIVFFLRFRNGKWKNFARI